MDETGETQLLLTDPDARSMASTARKPRIVGYNVQTAVEADFANDSDKDVYVCPVGENLTYRLTGLQDGKAIRTYWPGACVNCAIKAKCTTSTERRNGDGFTRAGLQHDPRQEPKAESETSNHLTLPEIKDFGRVM